MGHIAHDAVCAAPVEFAFAYAADYQKVPDWMMGVDELVPVSEQTTGLGATFETAVDLGPRSLPLRLETVEWSDAELFAFAVSGGIEASLLWRFEPVADQSRISVTLDYTVPGGLAGKLLDKLLQAFARVAVRHVDKHLRAGIERSYAQVASRP